MKYVQSLLSKHTSLKTALVLLSFYAASLLLTIATVALVLKWMAE